MKIKSKTHLILLVFLGAWLFLNSAMGQEAEEKAVEIPIEPGEGPKELKAFREAEKKVLDTFSKASNWTDDEKRKELRKALKMALVIHSERFIEPVIDYISFTYQDYMLSEIPKNTSDLLVSIGLPSVKEIVEKLKEDDAYKHLPYYALNGSKKGIENATKLLLKKRRKLYVDCLVRIYDKAGYGKKMALKRLELELAGTTSKKKKLSLTAAIKLIK